jgi:acetylornithine deacetylase/succinyl-diaminopimelate desuccinylase-like protein
MTIIEQHHATPYVAIPPDRSNTPKDQSPALARGFRALDKAVTEVWGRPPLYLREGGSVGLIADLKQVLGIDAVMPGLFLPEDNLHAPNESFHLGVMKKGIEMSERMLAELAKS